MEKDLGVSNSRALKLTTLFQINFSVYIPHTFGKDDKLAEMKIDVHALNREKTVSYCDDAVINCYFS